MGRAETRSPRGAARALSQPPRSATAGSSRQPPPGSGVGRARRLLARAATLAAGAAALACTAPATAAVLVSNIDQTVATNEALNTKAFAHEFTTGPGTGGYTLTSVEVKFGTAPNGTVRVRLTRDDLGVVHATLTNPSSLAAGNLTFTAPTGTTLAASTTYAVVVDSATSGALSLANTNMIDSGAAAGWSISTGAAIQDSGTWTSVLGEVLFRVNGDPVDTTAPTFVTAWVEDTALTLLFDEPLGAATLANTAFAVKKRAADGTESSVALGATAPSVSGRTVVLTLASALASTDHSVTVAYTKPTTGTGNRIVDAAANEAESFAEYVADVLVSNVDQATFPVSVDLDRTYAQVFTTGSNATGYTLAGVEVKFAAAPDSSLRVRILEAVQTGRDTFVPGNAIATLAHPSSLAAGNLRLTAPAGITLAAGTSYAVVIDPATQGSINFTNSGAEDAGGEAGWSVDALKTGANFGGTSNSFLQIRVSGTRNPVTLVSNTGQIVSTTHTVGFSSPNNWEAAIAFTTGPSEGGYTLSEVGAVLGAVSSASPKVSVYTTSSGSPDSSLHVLTNPASLTGNAVNTFTAAAGAALKANTTYAVVLQQTGRSGNYKFWATTSNGEDPGAASGWSIADSRSRRDAAAATPAWVTFTANKTVIAVKGRAVDTTPPALVSALVNGDKLRLTYDDVLAAAASLANSAFAVKKAGPGGTEADVALSTSTAPAVSGKDVVLTLASAIGATDRGFKVSYTQPDSGTANRIVNAAGLAAESLSEEAVARVLVSNLGQTIDDGRGEAFVRDVAQPFTTGSNAAGYTLTHAAIKLVQTSGEAPTYTVSVHDEASSNPGTSRGTLTNPASLPSAITDTVFTAAGNGIKLASGAVYWLVWDVSEGNTIGRLKVTASSAEDGGSATGWSISNGYKSRAFGATSWDPFISLSVPQIAIYGDIIPQPVVTDVRISSTPSHDEDTDGIPETYGRGAKIQVQVTFDRAVNVDTSGGTPQLTIKMDLTFGEKSASYEAGTGTKVLTFGYTVVEMNRSTQGVAVLENTLQLNSGTIKDAADATIDANLAHTGLTHNAAHLVDGRLEPDETAPAFASATVNGTTLAVTFDEALDPASAPAGSAFTVSGGRAGTGTARLSEATVTVTLDPGVPHGESVTVSYANPGTANSPLRDGSGNEVAGFSGQSVVNNTPGPPRTQPPGGGGGGGQPPRRPDPPPPSNRAPETAEEIEDLMLRVGAEVEIDLADAFDDPDDDELEYAAESSDSGVAAVELDGAALTVRAAGPGEAEIAVTAEDPDEEKARQTFDVTVTWPETVWYLPSAADPLRQGFVRVINHSDAAGEATVTATDDAGFAYEPLVLEFSPRQVRHFNSDDLELGNPDKGLTGATGPGTGAWRLVVESDEVDVEALAYARAADGFLTAMNDVVPREDGALRVAVFNPGSNVDQTSLLRLVNPSAEDAEATVTGVDDAGLSPGEPVLLELPAGSACTVDAAQLESGAGLACGSPQDGLGDGAGKWRLAVASEAPLEAMSLLTGPAGHLTNLSGRAAEDDEGVWHVDLFPAASDPLGRQGFVRVANRSDVDGRVTILAYDDSSTRYDALRLSLSAGQAAHFNSDDLELGNRAKGLSGSTGAGRGTWRLRMYSGLDIEANAYVRTPDGFLTAMQARAPAARPGRRVAILNPGSNLSSVGVLRLVNRSPRDAEVAIDGTDDLGLRPGTTVRVLVPATDAVELTAAELESGEHDAIASGALGDGAGKWRLRVASNRVNTVLSLLSSPGGHLTNLSGADAERELGELPLALLPAPATVTLESPGRRELRGRWSAVEGARYDVELMRDGVADEDRSLSYARNTTTTFRWTHLLPGTYAIRARSVNEDRLGGPWRTSEEVEID